VGWFKFAHCLALGTVCCVTAYAQNIGLLKGASTLMEDRAILLSIGAAAQKSHQQEIQHYHSLVEVNQAIKA